MELLAIPLGHQKTVTKWLVISEIRREQKFGRSILVICKEKFFASERFLHPKGVSNAVLRRC